MTFDDGNFSNHLILPLLNEYKIPAIFFIPTTYTKTQKAFWVDVLYRNRIKQGIDESKMWEEIVFLKKSNHIEIEKYLIQNFGVNSLKPIGDIDRPFNAVELKEFSKQKFVHIGNHTLDHASLPHYSEEDIRVQISDNQKDLLEITGITPDCIAFPYGDYSDSVVRVTEELGFKFAYTTVHKSNALPLKVTAQNLKLVNRFTVSMQPDILKRLDYLTSDYKIIDVYLKLRKNFMHR
jgi:peptidoglycan/xylan/chitin deacetylase (PgdA/CDA1 family)